MDPTDDRTTLLVAEAVFEALETPMEELPPLSDAVSLEGLDAVVSHGGARDTSVTFTYAGLRVLVHSCGAVWVQRTAVDGAPPVDGLFYDGR